MYVHTKLLKTYLNLTKTLAIHGTVQLKRRILRWVTRNLESELSEVNTITRPFSYNLLPSLKSSRGFKVTDYHYTGVLLCGEGRVRHKTSKNSIWTTLEWFECSIYTTMYPIIYYSLFIKTDYFSVYQLYCPDRMKTGQETRVR